MSYPSSTVHFGQLLLHSSVNVGTHKVNIISFFIFRGMSNSMDPWLLLIGDEAHVWSDTDVLNIDYGSSTKYINLSVEKEPDVFDVVHFSLILENVVCNSTSRAWLR